MIRSSSTVAHSPRCPGRWERMYEKLQSVWKPILASGVAKTFTHTRDTKMIGQQILIEFWTF